MVSRAGESSISEEGKEMENEKDEKDIPDGRGEKRLKPDNLLSRLEGDIQLTDTVGKKRETHNFQGVTETWEPVKTNFDNRKEKLDGRRDDRSKADNVQKSVEGGNQIAATVRKKRDTHDCNSCIENYDPLKLNLDVLVSPERNRWSVTPLPAARDCCERRSSAGHEFDLKRTEVTNKRLAVGMKNQDGVERMRTFDKRGRDEELTGLLARRRKRRVGEDTAKNSDRERVVQIRSQARKINPQAVLREEKGTSRCRTKPFRAEVHAEMMDECRWAKQALTEEHQNYGENRRRYVKDETGQNEANQWKNSPLKRREKRLMHFRHGLERFDSSSYSKDRLDRFNCDNIGCPASLVRSGRKCVLGKNRKFSREMNTRNHMADRRMESDMHSRATRETDDLSTRRRSAPELRESDEGRRQMRSHAKHLGCSFVQEKLDHSSIKVRTDRAARIDVTGFNHEIPLTTNVWEVKHDIKRKFSSKIVVPRSESEEPDANDGINQGGATVVDEYDQAGRKDLSFVSQDLQDYRTQKTIRLDKPKKDGLFAGKREDRLSKVFDYDSKKGTDRAPLHRPDIASLDHEIWMCPDNSKSANIAAIKDKVKTLTKGCNAQQRNSPRKFRYTKDEFESQGPDDYKDDLELRLLGLSKKNEDLKDITSRKSPETHPSRPVTKSGKEITVKSKESLLKIQALNVGRARAGRGQDFSSNEPRYHKHRVRSHSASPKIRNLSPQEKEHGRSTSPRRSETEWEKFERERNNTLAAFDSRYRRFGGGTSGLGGYSPRRRRSEAAIKTPSPPPRSPERRKPRAWDLPPPGMDSSMVAAISAAQQAVVQQAAIQHAAAVLASATPLVSGSVLLSPGATSASASCGLTPAPTMMPSLLQQVNPAVTAVTLTQATRPLRRLYVGNVPATVSDGELLEFMNAAMLSANANHLAGTKPCINCSVNVDKSYAFAEFITPEDATAALAFDGVTLHGATLKIRRPKDFAQPANGGAESASPILDMVSSTVADSPRKVFIGGISSSLSAEKVKEIVTAFGQLKAYHWEVDRKKQPPQAYAFLEYMDPSATLKACAGLNGMKLGTNYLTVVQATPVPRHEVATTDTPCYEVPEHAKTLLQPASRVLELQNLVSEDELRMMSRKEIDEICDDIRLECSRFGNVKSMQFVQPEREQESMKDEGNCSIVEEGDDGSTNGIRSFVANVRLEHERVTVRQIDHGSQGSLTDDICNEIHLRAGIDTAISAGENTRANLRQMPNISSSDQIIKVSGKDSGGRAASCGDRVLPGTQAPTRSENITDEGNLHTAPGVEKVVEYGDVNTPPEFRDQDNGLARTGLVGGDSNGSLRSVNSLCGGTIFVEFSREESACQAAHALHGRTFAGRNVVAGYFALKMYQKKFHKGLTPRTNEEKQALALAVQGHLTAHIKDL